jgi:hypothetical protein
LVHIKGINVYTMYAQTEEQKRRWIKALEDALTNIQPEECRRTDHMLTMYTFEKGSSCSQCSKFMKGLFYQGYRCVRCDANTHRECISSMHPCGTVHPPELPPRPPLLPLMNAASSTTITVFLFLRSHFNRLTFILLYNFYRVQHFLKKAQQVNLHFVYHPVLLQLILHHYH